MDPAGATIPAPERGGRARVLVDLAHAADGYVGIAQDTRLNFDMLASIAGVAAEGLLMPTGRHDLPALRADDPNQTAIQAGVVHWMARNWDASRLHTTRGRAAEVVSSLRTRHGLVRFQGSKNVLWRTLFEKTLAADRRDAVLAQAFHATDLSVMRIIDRAVRLRGLPMHRLETTGFDYALFSMPRPVRLSPGTRQLVRFHDAVPVTDIDTQNDWTNALAHQQLTRRCPSDAVFVCNSPQSRDDLMALDPSRESSAEVIPCAIAPLPRSAAGVPFELIASVRRSFRTLNKPPLSLPPITPDARYILTIGTLEPRKNHHNLIRAWERVISRSDPTLQLVIVGNPGWQEGQIVAAMAPHVRSGRILHLERLPHDELIKLARGAECFVFPSFHEGFGYPPLEALQAGASCLVSDIPVFRWIFGDGATFVDPYDVEEIATGIERLVVHEDRDALRAAMMSRRASVLDRFSIPTIRCEWERLFEQLQRRRRGVTARRAAETAPEWRHRDAPVSVG